jgi:hypothetical protein
VTAALRWRGGCELKARCIAVGEGQLSAKSGHSTLDNPYPNADVPEVSCRLVR